MNERIKDLAEQAGIVFWEISGDVDWRQANREHLEKFAELIVQDVIDILATYRVRVTFDDGIEHNCQHPIQVIQKHFGVEE